MCLMSISSLFVDSSRTRKGYIKLLQAKSLQFITQKINVFKISLVT